jgi:hypothetical protein
MKDMSLWSVSLRGDTQLKDITMPGSHDAGIYPGDVSQTGPGSISLKRSLTQSGSIYEQCMAGSRFFDVRFKEESGAVRAYHQTAGMGALGGTDDKILADVAKFLSSRGSEFVILRISHTKESTGILQKILSSPLASKLYKGSGNIALTPISALRGKAICIFDSDDFSAASLTQTAGFHPFAKYSGGGGVVGLQTCGKYANDNSIRNVISSQLGHTHQHKDHPRDHLFVLYWTQTGGYVEDNTRKPVNEAKALEKHRATGGAHHNMDYMLSMLQGGGSKYGETFTYTKGAWTKKQTITVQPTTWQDRRDHFPNVIMYDFVNAETSNKIVTLNQPNLQGILINAH